MPVSKMLEDTPSESDPDESCSVGSLECSDQNSRAPAERLKRSAKVPARYRQSFAPSLSRQEILAGEEKVMVKCSQSGDRFVKTVCELSHPDEQPLAKRDLQQGTSLVADIDGCPYPVEVVGLVDELRSKVTGMKKKDQLKKVRSLKNQPMVDKRKILSAAREENAPKPKRLKTATSENEQQASHSQSQFSLTPEKLTESEESSSKPRSSSTLEGVTHTADSKPTGNFSIPFTKEDHDMLLDIHSMVKKLVRRQISEGTTFRQPACKAEAEDQKFVVNGVNLLSLRARDVYQYSLSLMDNLFKREEMANSLVKKTPRSSKPPLDGDRVQLIEVCLEKKFGNAYDRKGVLARMNQKCHDARKGLFKEDALQL